MRMMTGLMGFYFIFTFIAFANDHSSASFATVFNECEPPEAGPNGHTHAIGQWVSISDYMKDMALRKKENVGDIQLDTGPIIDANCVTGARKNKADTTLKNLKTAIDKALIQAYRCDRALGLPAAGSSFSILRRARISCKNAAPHIGAANDLFKRNLWYAPLTETKRNVDHSYQFIVPPHTIDVKDFDSYIIASFLFHEGLHSTANNNHDEWHASAEKTGHTFGCANSLFEDRIYFIHSACFPNTVHGKHLTNIMNKCPNVCESAFTKVNRKTTFAAGSGSAAIYGLSGNIGPDLNARPLGRQEAKMLCNRITQTNESNLKLKEELKQTKDSIHAARKGLKKTPLFPKGNSQETGRLELKILAIEEKSDLALNPPYNWEARIAEMVKNEAEIKNIIEETCAKKPIPNDWVETCAFKGNYILKEIRTWTERVREWPRRNREPSLNRLASPRDILMFYELRSKN